MKLSKIILLFVAAGISGKCAILLTHGRFLESLGWLVAGGWIVWIVYAYQVNKDLPAAGPFRYAEGGNQLARILYAISMTLIYFLAAIFQN